MRVLGRMPVVSVGNNPETCATPGETFSETAGMGLVMVENVVNLHRKVPLSR